MMKQVPLDWMVFFSQMKMYLEFGIKQEKKCNPAILVTAKPIDTTVHCGRIVRT